MPGGNRTGPMGQGPRTGRGAGYCGDREESDVLGGRGGGRGFRRGRRGGRSGGDDRLRSRIEELEQKIARMERND